jgi:DNA-binding FadR family transcriptional regulator
MNVLDLPIGGRRYLDIAHKLAADIESGHYGEGERLPPERELAQMLDVSRTTVREALLALEIMRYIEIRVGSGVFVLEETARGQSPQTAPQGASPSDVLAARRIIEAETAALAALHASEANLAALAKTIDQMSASIDRIDRFDAADADFHALIASAAGNEVLGGFVTHLWRMRESDMWAFCTTRPATQRTASDPSMTTASSSPPLNAACPTRRARRCRRISMCWPTAFTN